MHVSTFTLAKFHQVHVQDSRKADLFIVKYTLTYEAC